MEEYKSLEKKRRKKQLIMAAVFFLVLIGGWFFPLWGFFIPLCMLLGLGIGIFKGRKWCDWLCPRGSFYDTLIKPISPKTEIPSFFKNMRFRIVILALLMLIMTSNLLAYWPDFWQMGKFLVRMVAITTILGVILALIFHQRTWCVFCPVGTAANLIGKDRAPLKINSDLCVECKLCAQNCPIQIKPYKFKDKGTQIVKDAGCLKCNLCIAVCPKRALGTQS